MYGKEKPLSNSSQSNDNSKSDAVLNVKIEGVQQAGQNQQHTSQLSNRSETVAETDKKTKLQIVANASILMSLTLTLIMWLMSNNELTDSDTAQNSKNNQMLSSAVSLRANSVIKTSHSPFNNPEQLRVANRFYQHNQN